MNMHDSRSPDMNTQIQRALSHPKRTEILGFLMQKRDATGASKEEIAAACDIGGRALEYHLKVLQGADLIARSDGEQAWGAERSYVAAASRRSRSAG